MKSLAGRLLESVCKDKRIRRGLNESTLLQKISPVDLKGKGIFPFSDVNAFYEKEFEGSIHGIVVASGPSKQTHGHPSVYLQITDSDGNGECWEYEEESDFKKAFELGNKLAVYMRDDEDSYKVSRYAEKLGLIYVGNC